MTDQTDPHPGETWLDVGMRRLDPAGRLPLVPVRRGGITYPYREIPRRAPVVDPTPDPDDPAVLAHPDLCNHRWGANRLHLCDEPVGHEPDVDGILSHRCRCGDHEDVAGRVMTGDELRAEAIRRIARAMDIPESFLDVPAAPYLVAYGGFCAPASGVYDLWGRPWTRPDLPWPWRIDVERWLFPRLFRFALARAELRRRLGLVVGALRGAQLVEARPADEDDD